MQAKVDCLEVEKRSLEAQLLSERRQATESAKEALSLKGQLEEEKGAASKARQQAEELRDTIRHLEDEAELMKVRMCDVCACACVHVCVLVVLVCHVHALPLSDAPPECQGEQQQGHQGGYHLLMTGTTVM